MARRSYLLAAVTTGLTFALILLGELTAVSGSGATCSLQWPYCNGQLLPFGLPLHDFIEWFHRFVAMIVGFFILGTGLVAWRNYDARDVKYAGVLAVVLLPVQVVLGGTTVTFSGLVPWGYQPITQAVHHLAALAIYAALVYATVRMREQSTAGVGGLWTPVVAGLAWLPVSVALSRNTVFTVYGTRLQLLHHAVELLVLTAALVAGVRAHRSGVQRATRAMAAASVFVTLQVLLGVGIVAFSPAVQLAYYVLAAGIAAAFVVTARVATRGRPAVAAT